MMCTVSWICTVADLCTCIHDLGAPGQLQGQQLQVDTYNTHRPGGYPIPIAQAYKATPMHYIHTTSGRNTITAGQASILQPTGGLQLQHSFPDTNPMLCNNLSACGKEVVKTFTHLHRTHCKNQIVVFANCLVITVA